MRWVDMSLCGLVILMVLAVPVQSAERDKASFPPPVGERVRVDASTHQLSHHVVTVMAASGDTLWLGRAYERPRAVPVRSITRLEVWHAYGSRARHAVIGAGAGMLIGGIALGALEAYTDAKGRGGDDKIAAMWGVIVGIPLGLVVGTTVGLVLPTGKWEEVTLPVKVSLRSYRDSHMGLALTLPVF
ncbi:MAG: hypothetical protein V1694_04285 [Candidatus Eisenbacteria bacterium]